MEDREHRDLVSALLDSYAAVRLGCIFLVGLLVLAAVVSAVVMLVRRV